MDLDLFRQLLAPTGQDLLAEAMQLQPTDSTFLACHTRLCKTHPDTLVKAALQTALLRQRARVKFNRADQMYFLREPLEQATREAVSLYRAERYQSYSSVMDLCCGIGGDALGLASVCTDVVAIDVDALHLAMAEENVRVYGFGDRFSGLQADVLSVPDKAEAYFCDPDRRTDGKRHLSLRACQPTVDDLLAQLPRGAPVGIKLAPGASWSELSEYDAEVEFISFEGELKECVLWFGPHRQVARRATLLPGPHSIAADEPAVPVGPSEPGEFLYDPDPAVVRAGLVNNLAEELDAKQMDSDSAYLTSHCQKSTPFAQTCRIVEAHPFHLKRLRSLLRSKNLGSIIVRKRGVAVDVNTLIRQLKLTGDKHQHLVLCRVNGRATVLFVEPL